MIRIETERLILRNYSEADINDVFEYMSHEEVARYEDFHPMSMEEVSKWVIDNSKKDSRLVAELKDTGKVIGSVGYFFDGEDDEDEAKLRNYRLDFDFNPLYGKKGYATESARGVVAHIFNDLGGRRIGADCDVRNDNSWKLLERLGFRREGHLIEGTAYKGDKNDEPIIISIYLYAMLHREFKELTVMNS